MIGQVFSTAWHGLAASGQWLERQDWWNPKANPRTDKAMAKKKPSAWDNFMAPPKPAAKKATPKKRKKATATSSKRDIHIIIKQ